jgi:hypothetical protein
MPAPSSATPATVHARKRPGSSESSMNTPSSRKSAHRFALPNVAEERCPEGESRLETPCTPFLQLSARQASATSSAAATATRRTTRISPRRRSSATSATDHR